MNPSQVSGPSAIPSLPAHPAFLPARKVNPTYEEQSAEILQLREQIRALGAINMDQSITIQMNSWVEQAVDKKVSLLKEKLIEEQEKIEFLETKSQIFEGYYKDLKKKYDEQAKEKDIEITTMRKEIEELRRQLGQSSVPSNKNPFSPLSVIPCTPSCSSTSSSSFSSVHTNTPEGVQQSSAITSTMSPEVIEIIRDFPVSLEVVTSSECIVEPTKETPIESMPVLEVQTIENDGKEEEKKEEDNDIIVISQTPQEIKSQNFEKIKKEWIKAGGENKYNLCPDINWPVYLFDPNGKQEAPQFVTRVPNPFSLYSQHRKLENEKKKKKEEKNKDEENEEQKDDTKQLAQSHYDAWNGGSSEFKELWKTHWVALQKAAKEQIKAKWIVFKPSAPEKRKAPSMGKKSGKKRAKIDD